MLTNRILGWDSIAFYIESRFKKMKMNISEVFYEIALLQIDRLCAWSSQKNYRRTWLIVPICLKVGCYNIYSWVFSTITILSHERYVVPNHRSFDCIFNSLCGPTSKKQQKSPLLALCERNSLVTGEFPAQRASNARKASIWWRHHAMIDTFVRIRSSFRIFC